MKLDNAGRTVSILAALILLATPGLAVEAPATVTTNADGVFAYEVTFTVGPGGGSIVSLEVLGISNIEEVFSGPVTLPIVIPPNGTFKLIVAGKLTPGQTSGLVHVVSALAGAVDPTTPTIVVLPTTDDEDEDGDEDGDDASAGALAGAMNADDDALLELGFERLPTERNTTLRGSRGRSGLPSSSARDRMLTALSGGYDVDTRLGILRGLVGRVDAAMNPLLRQHITRLRDDAAAEGRADLVREADGLLDELDRL